MPVLFLLEDLHWADEASLDLLAFLLREAAALPVLLVAVTRPTLLERLPDWWERIPGQQRLDLQPLDETSSRLLLREILQKAAAVLRPAGGTGHQRRRGQSLLPGRTGENAD